jgi:hypothetical protein
MKIKTWQERYEVTGGNQRKSAAMQSEIADLRALIAAKEAQPSEPKAEPKPLPGADWTITMRRMMDSGCSKKKCTCKPEDAPNCIWWDEPGDRPQPKAEPAKAVQIVDTLKAEPVQEPHPPHRQCGCDDCKPSFEAEPARLTDAEIYRWLSSENGLEDCNMAVLVDFNTVVRAIESKIRGDV